MAIVNTFQKCLETPYLIEDKDAPDRIGELLAKAGDRQMWRQWPPFIS